MPQYTVSDPNPSFIKSAVSANLGDISRFAFWTVAGTAIGYYSARPFSVPAIRRMNGGMGLLLGSVGGFLIMTMRSEQRLMGKRA